MTIKYNLPHLDAAENVFFQRELEQILTEQFDIKYAGLKARQLVPVNNNIDPGTESVTYRSFESVGAAKLISDYSADFPSVNVKGTESTSIIKSYGASFHYSIQELRAGARNGRGLDRMRAASARKVLDLALDNVASTGDSAASLKGLLNQSSTLTFTLGTKTAGGLTWAVATSDEIIADLFGIVNKIRVDTKEVENPTRILLPTAMHTIAASKPRSSTSDVTVLNFFKMSNPGIEVMPWERLTGAGSGATNRIVAYDPQAMNVQLLMAVEYEQMVPEPRNMSYVVNCHMRTGGVIAPYPQSICYADGA